MMLKELQLVLDKVGLACPQSSYRSAILDDNVLGKPTRSTRERTAERLVELYGLDPQLAVFHSFRTYWSCDPANQPMLAFLLATARDPLLRATNSFILGVPWQQAVTTQVVGEHLQQQHPGRFRPTTLRSTARNLASTWTQAGYLQGKLAKCRIQPRVTPQAAAFALLLGHLQGLRGSLLLDSQWARLLDRPAHDVSGLAAEASKQGWLRYKSAGAVTEITFPGFLEPAEERIA